MTRLVKIVGKPTRDQDRNMRSWTGAVGFKIATRQPMGGGKRWMELKNPGADTGVVLFTPDGHEDRIGIVFNGSFGCDDVDYTYKRMRSRGVEFEGPPEKQPWGTFAKIKDLDGTSFVLTGR